MNIHIYTYMWGNNTSLTKGSTRERHTLLRCNATISCLCASIQAACYFGGVMQYVFVCCVFCSVLHIVSMKTCIHSYTMCVKGVYSYTVCVCDKDTEVREGKRMRGRRRGRAELFDGICRGLVRGFKSTWSLRI